jgi:hypothetical protein
MTYVVCRYDESSVGAEERSLPPSVKIEPPSRKPSSAAVGSDSLPAYVFDSRLDPKTRARMIENEMNEQAKLVQDLHQLRASRNTIETEERKLHELQVSSNVIVFAVDTSTFVSIIPQANMSVLFLENVSGSSRRIELSYV